MARGKRNSVIESLSGDMSERTKLALEVARLCYCARTEVAHPDKVYVSYCLTLGWAEIKTGEVKLDSAESYARFINFACDIWQLFIFGLID